jgi:hypothetical protein
MEEHLQALKAKKAKKPNGIDPNAWPPEHDAEMSAFFGLPPKEDREEPKAERKQTSTTSHKQRAKKTT